MRPFSSSSAEEDLFETNENKNSEEEENNESSEEEENNGNSEEEENNGNEEEREDTNELKQSRQKIKKNWQKRLLVGKYRRMPYSITTFASTGAISQRTLAKTKSY